MKKLCILLAFLALCCYSGAVYASGNTIIQLPDGSYVGSNNPLPITGTLSTGVPPVSNSTTIVSAVVTPQNVASLAGRKSISFLNQSSTVTAWLSMNTSTASAAAGIGIPLPPYAFFSTELDDSIVVGVAAAGVASITVYQDAN